MKAVAMRDRLMRPMAMVLLLAATLALSGCKTDLYTNLTEYEANQMLAVMMAANIPAEKKAVDDTFSVRVEEADMLRAIALLNDKGLPRNTRDSIGKVFQKSGIISSPFEERVRYVYALGEELAQTIAQIDGVVSSRVHIVLPEEPQLGKPAKPSSASVFIKHEPNVDLEYLLPQIRRLVSSAIEGLDYASVTVVLTEATRMETTPVAAEPALVEVFPGLTVLNTDAGRFRTLLYATGSIFLVLLAGTAFAVAQLVLRLRKRSAAPSTASAETLMEPS